MIVDTSALIAILLEESGHQPLLRAIASEQCLIPAPVMTEFMRATMRKGHSEGPLLDFASAILSGPASVVVFDENDARESMLANKLFGSGLGNGGKLNLLDLMVYGAAKTRGMPILCTGTDFPSTDAIIHPASRLF